MSENIKFNLYIQKMSVFFTMSQIFTVFSFIENTEKINLLDQFKKFLKSEPCKKILHLML